MRNLLRRLMGLIELEKAIELARRQSEFIRIQQKMIEDLQAEQIEVVRTMNQIVLGGTRALRDQAVAYRLAVETPEVDIREDLDQLIRDLEDQLAVMEEQIVL